MKDRKSLTVQESLIETANEEGGPAKNKKAECVLDI